MRPSATHGRSSVWVRRAVAGLMVAGLLVGCSNAPTGVVHGLLGVHEGGGLSNANKYLTPIAGAVEAMVGSKVIATVTVPVANRGTFTLRLPPGSYELKALPKYPEQGGCQLAPVRVRANATSSVQVPCWALPASAP